MSLSACLLLLFSLHSPSASAQHLEEKPNGNRLAMASYHNLAPINPILTSTTISTSLITIIYDGLVRYDEKFEPQPNLAESWRQSPDGLTWTFFLRKNVRFHNGEELTADDVAFTYESIRSLGNKARFSHIIQEIDNIAVINPHQLQITLKKPLAPFLQFLLVGILPKHSLIGKDMTEYLSHQDIIGTGPYKFKSWSAEKIILQANEDYFLGRPHIDEIHVAVYPNPETFRDKLMAGEIDYFYYPEIDKIEVMQRLPSFHFYFTPTPYYYLITFNLQDPLFKDPLVRRALNYAINKEEIINKSLDNHAQPAAGTVYPDSWAYNAKVKPYPYNPQKALALLKEAGWEDRDGDHLLEKDGKVFQFTIHIGTLRTLKKKVFLPIQQQLRDIGIQTNITFFDAADMELILKKRFQALFSQMVAVGDPDTSYLFWHASRMNGGFNVFSYNNPEVNRLLDEGRTTLNVKKRRELYFQYQETMHQDPPGIFLFWTSRLVSIHERFKNVSIGPVGYFLNIHEWYVPKAEQRIPTTGN